MPISRYMAALFMCTALWTVAAGAQSRTAPPSAQQALFTLKFPDSLEAEFQKLRQSIPRVTMEPLTLLAFVPDTVRNARGGFTVIVGDTLLMVSGDSMPFVRTRFVVTNDSVVRIEPLPRVVVDTLRADLLRLIVDGQRALQNVSHKVNR